MKILISDNLSKQGVDILQKAGLTVDVRTKMPKDELVREIKQYEGLIVRSATKVTAEVIAAAEKLRIIGRRSEEHTSELQSPYDLVCRLLLEKKKKNQNKLIRNS